MLLGSSLLLASSLVQATIPNITGTYVGTLSGTETCPGPPIVTSPDSVTLSISFTNQVDTVFTGTGTDDESSTFTIAGTIDAAGNVTGAIDGTSNPDPFAASFTGLLSGNSLSLSVNGADINPPNCSFSLSGTLNRTTGDLTVNPTVTPSSTVTNPILLNTQVEATTNDLAVRIGDVLRSSTGGPRKTSTGYLYSSDSGLNAGDIALPYGVWASYSYSDFENDLSSTALDGTRHGVLAGIDITPWEQTVVGLAIGYEYSDIDTTFNAGNQEVDGFTIAPYFGYLLTDNWSIDFSVGYSNVEADQFRTLPGTTTRVTSSPSTERWFGMFNLNGFTTYENWSFGVVMGTLWAKSEQESFTESNGNFNAETTNKLGQWRLGGDVGYWYGEFEPFARFSYQHDYSATEITVIGGPQPANDRDGFLFGLGVRYFGSNGITGNLEWNKRLDREDFEEDTITLTIRADF